MNMVEDTQGVRSDHHRNRRAEQIAALIRLAKRATAQEDRDLILDLVEELATEEPRVGRVGEMVRVDFPLQVWINTRKGPQYGVLNADATLEVGGMRLPNPSAAAEQVLKYKTNGWRVWRFAAADGQSRTIEVLRHWDLFRP